MPPDNQSSRGEKTRDALLTAAMEVFGRAGYDSSSTRVIAEAAGANQALIGYHFGGKRGLYLAVFEHIAEQMQRELLPRVDSVQAQLQRIEAADPARTGHCVDAIATLLCALLDVLARPESKTWARLVMREQQDPGDAFDILYTGFMRRLLGTLSRLAAVAEGLEEENEATRLRAIFLSSQVLMFVMAPAAVDRHMGWPGGAPANLATIKTNLRGILQQQFTGGVTP